MGFFDALTQLWPFGGGKKVPPGKPAGSDGVQTIGGYLFQGEKSHELQGQRLWLHYSDMLANASAVAMGWRFFLNMVAGTQWEAEPNPAGGADAEHACEIVRAGLFEADMEIPWNAVVKKQALYKGYGYAMHEAIIKRRLDGMIVYASIEHRPQYTIRWWNKPDEQGPLLGVQQLTRQGNTYYLPMDRLWYIADNALTDSPEGVGMLRHVVAKVKRLERYEQLEGFGYETDLRGIPIGRAPLSNLQAAATSSGLQGNQQSVFINSQISSLTGFAQGHIKTPELALILDSQPYTDPDGKISSVPKWAMDLLKGDGAPLEQIAKAIDRINREIARVLGVEFLMMGGSSGGSGAGSSAMHEDKTAQFANMVQSTLNEMAASARQQLARRLVAFNGLDPDTCTPRLIPGAVSTESVMMIAQALAALAQAGAPIMPDDPAINQLRARLHLAAAPVMSIDAQGPIKPAPDDNEDNEPPDPDKGEVDVEVEDLGDGIGAGGGGSLGGGK